MHSRPLVATLILTAALVATVAAGCAKQSLIHVGALKPTTDQAIAFGTNDSIHTAVVSLLASGGGGSFSECSGSIVQVTNGTAYVLTAAHCCDEGAPNIIVMGSDYTPGENALFGGGISPPVFAVDQSSVFFDSQYNQQDHDFCMFKVPGVPANTPVLALPTTSDGADIGVDVEHVGFGVTDSNTNNTTRHSGIDTITDNSDVVISYVGGGSSQTPDTCEGDSGGPALIPAGAPQAQQHIVACTSFGTTSNCGASDTGTSSRVSSELGAGGFITEFLNDTPIGSQPGAATGDCNSCAQNAENGACAQAASTCGNDQACIDLSNCEGQCNAGDNNCISSCEQQAGSGAVNELNAFDGCICNTACTSECAAECGGTQPPADCGLSTGDATCDGCIGTSCCAEATNCANDQACIACANDPSCTSNALLGTLENCLGNNCASECGAPATGEGEGEGAAGGEGEGQAAGGEGEGEGSRRDTSDETNTGDPSGCGCSASTNNGAMAVLIPWTIVGLVAFRARRRR